MLEIITKSYHIYLNDLGKVMLAKDLKTGKFVSRAEASKELEPKDNQDFALSSLAAVIACINAVVSAVVYCYTNNVATIFLSIVVSLAVFTVASLYVINTNN